MNLLIGCSKLKRDIAGRAADVYIGKILVLALRYADFHGYEPYIVSARYGILTPDDWIEPYDEKLDRPYPGPWPDGPGNWVGSKVYFQDAPERYTRLLPEGYNQSYGQQKRLLMEALRTGHAF